MLFRSTSAGSIAAAFAATGAGPEAVQSVAQDPRLAKLYDPDLDVNDGGLLNGQKAYDLFDQKLRELTGIKDRPVTFADLKVPLQLIAAKTYDSAAGANSMTSPSDRTFVFSQETTPDTPVALAMRASMAIPGVFEPVQMVDPSTGQEVHLVDGGTLDNLPMGYSHDGLPTIGASLATRDGGHPADHPNTAKPLPAGNLDSTNLLWNAVNGYTLLKESGADYNDYQDRTQPKANQFMLSVPTWDLKDPSKSDSTLKFGYDPKVDPALDQQSRQVTRDFLRNFLDDMRVPGAKGTNFSADIPKNLNFNVPVDVKGQKYQVSYSGGDSLTATPASGGRPITLKMGQQRIEAMYLDNQAFGDLKNQLAYALADPHSVRPSWLPF